jgi:hypothetical protein
LLLATEVGLAPLMDHTAESAEHAEESNEPNVQLFFGD